MATHMHSYGSQGTYGVHGDALTTDAGTGIGSTNGKGNGNNAANSVTVNLNGLPLSQQLSQQSQHSQHQSQQSQLFSPPMSSAADESMAILSPPASRYAFDPNISGTSFSQLDGSVGTASVGVQSHQVSPVNDLNFASLSLISSPQPYGQDNDIPAFDSLMEQKLENFTNDLQSFNNWIKSLNNEQKKTAIGMFIDSIVDTDVLDFIQNKVTSIDTNTETNNFFSPSIGVNANPSLPQHLRPVSPIIPISTSISQVQNENKDVEVPLTLDSILNQNEEDDNSLLLHKPEPKRMFSPPTIKSNSYLNTLINSDSPCERPKSAGPIYNFNSYNGLMSPILPTTVTGMDSINSITTGSDFSLDAKLHHSLNTINSRTMLESSSTNANTGEERGRRKYSQNRNGNSMNNFSQINGLQGMSNAMNMMNMNMNMSNFNNFNTMNMGYNNNSSSMANMMNTIGYNNNNNSNSNSNNNNNHNNNNVFTNIGSLNAQGAGTPITTTNSSVNSLNGTNGTNGTKGLHGSYGSYGYYGTSGINGHVSHGSHGSHSSFKHLKAQHTQSSSVPPNNRIRSVNAGTTSSLSGNYSNNVSTKKKGATNSNNIGSGLAKDDSSNLPKDIASDSLLNDIPSWLKALRLHKYTENLQHLSWQEMVSLDDAALEKAGVSTVGARNKLLKSFKYVREQRDV